jgi:DNA helicase HerA-like ATPase
VLYIDEAHNFLNLPYAIEDLLAEARGLHMGLVLAHQHLGQLGRELADGISANARNKVFFNASPEDAHRLQRHTLPELGEEDLARMGAWEAGCRLIVDGVATPAFTLRTDPPAPIVGKAEEIRAEATGRQPRKKTDQLKKILRQRQADEERFGEAA